jgi:hypothetical protein
MMNDDDDDAGEDDVDEAGNTDMGNMSREHHE